MPQWRQFRGKSALPPRGASTIGLSQVLAPGYGDQGKGGPDPEHVQDHGDQDECAVDPDPGDVQDHSG